MEDSIGAGENIHDFATLPNALRIITISEEEFVLGNSFSARDYITIPATESRFLSIDFTGATGLQNIVFEPLIFTAVDAGPILIDLSVNPTFTGGTQLTTFNRRATSGNPSQADLRLLLPGDVSANGTKFSGRLIPSTSGPGINTGTGAESAGKLPFEIDPAIIYLAELQNTDLSVAAIMEYNVTWIESRLKT